MNSRPCGNAGIAPATSKGGGEGGKPALVFQAFHRPAFPQAPGTYAGVAESLEAPHQALSALVQNFQSALTPPRFRHYSFL